jgi:ACR3 family arsenite efflux pump ArsB
MLIALNRLRRRHRHRLAAVLLALTLCCAVVAAHSALADGHMGDNMAVCLAVAQTAALFLAVAIAAGLAAAALRPRVLHRRVVAPAAWAMAAAPEPRSRAGPSVLQVFRL